MLDGVHSGIGLALMWSANSLGMLINTGHKLKRVLAGGVYAFGLSCIVIPLMSHLYAACIGLFQGRAQQRRGGRRVTNRKCARPYFDADLANVHKL